ncbi:hypothetical protein AGMMS49975_24190 [Clostridia bacterium]|nr:hypothetical protein AGMMS49975_24140 [Clostridia bacterium]GHU57970.1 hypothetical protein AGMMS49975_24190 [Clostridia bacterium]GHU76431.1 hypothetical protein FACS1894188_08940 [Clostridia bacterium]
MRSKKVKVISITKERVMIYVYAAILAAGVFFGERAHSRAVVSASAVPTNKKVVVIDAGHGGWDRRSFS